MDFSSIKGEMKDIDWKAIENRKQEKRPDIVRPNENKGGGSNMGYQSFGGNRGGYRQPPNSGNNRNGNHDKNYSSSNSGEKEVVFWITEENYLDKIPRIWLLPLKSGISCLMYRIFIMSCKGCKEQEI